jgi:chorismate dehydratase
MSVKITAVSYLNTYPFVYGLRNSANMPVYSLKLEVPSLCAKSIREGSADIGLVPVAALPELRSISLVTDFCIGAIGEVKTVLLLSTVPVEQCNRIYLDFDSRTSVQLIRILAREYWKIQPEWVALQPGETPEPLTQSSVVAIGDKTFTLRKHYPFIYDLSEVWYKMTGDPFVFAVWVMKNPVNQSVVQQLNDALDFGVKHKKESLDYFRDQLPACGNCLDYLENNISYALNENKRRGLEKFLSLIG